MAISPRLAIRTGPITVPRAPRSGFPCRLWAAARSRPERPRDHQLLHLVGALADGEDLRVAVEAAHRVLLDVAVAAVDLHGFLRAAHREPPRLELRLRGGEAERAPLVLQPGGLVGEQARRLDLGGHVGELGLDGLEPADRLPERAPLLGVGERLVERALGEADAHRRDADAPDVEHVEELAEALPARPEQVLVRHAAVREAQWPGVRGVPAHLAIRLALLVARGAVLDDEVRDLLIARPRGQRDVPGDVRARVGDE